VKGTTLGTITDANGEFSLDPPPGSVLEFSFIGFKSQRITYTDQTTISIVMVEETSELAEVVVTGYTSVAKRDITGVVTTLHSDKIKDISMNGFDQGLQGQVAGVQVSQSSGTPGGGGGRGRCGVISSGLARAGPQHACPGCTRSSPAGTPRRVPSRPSSRVTASPWRRP